MPVAILDFGTNTFNLLIAEKTGSSFRVLYDGKQGVKLGKGGINKRLISDEAMERGYAAIANHMRTIREYGVNEIYAFATSAMRNAENGRQFADLIRDKFGFETNIISGDEEASLIYTGITASVKLTDEPAMILDIGGGSNEFIICNSDGILWKRSFELGMARIIEKFDLSDPITSKEIRILEAYFDSELTILGEQVKHYNPKLLIGASGSFDTLAAMAKERFGINQDAGVTFFELNKSHYNELHQLLLHSTTAERLVIPGMESVRVEMIVPASIFINFICSKYGIQTIIQSGYALKEGVMARLINQ